jgi:hypothetical protein
MVSICNFLPPPSPRVRRRVSYTISLTINLFTTNGKGKFAFFRHCKDEYCKEKIARNSCLSFCVLTECSQKFEPLRPVLLSLVA